MGFGYLTIGYLVTFIFNNLAEPLGVGGLALLVGYGIMLLGLFQLHTFHSAFGYAKWTLIPLLLTALYDCFRSLAGLFLWNLPFLHGTFNTVVDWIKFFLLLFFNLAMLFGISEIAKEVGLLRIRSAAIRNALFVGGYAVLYLLASFPFDAITKYLSISVILVQWVWILCNLFLLITCTKDICREGDEDQPVKESRWKLLNTLNNAYDKNRSKAVNKVMSETEERLKKRQEERNKKKIHHKKKK